MFPGRRRMTVTYGGPPSRGARSRVSERLEASTLPHDTPCHPAASASHTCHGIFRYFYLISRAGSSLAGVMFLRNIITKPTSDLSGSTCVEVGDGDRTSKRLRLPDLCQLIKILTTEERTTASAGKVRHRNLQCE